jgi:carbamoyltransferase
MIIINNKEEAVDLLIKQNIVCIFQGESEWGDRALGNRSLLFDPRNENAQKIINIFKGREWWRPLAGTILLEHAHEWFDMAGLKESPFMSFAMYAKEKAKNLTPSIIHADNTCRIQTVTREQNRNYYDLIEVFYQKTDVPILLNTSFNFSGFPIVEKIMDIEVQFNKLNNNRFEYVYLPKEMHYTKLWQ